MNTTNTILAQAVARATRVQPEPGTYAVTDAEAAVMDRQGTEFVDACIAEALRDNWFGGNRYVRPQRSTLTARVYEAIAQQQPISALEIGATVGCYQSATNTAIRELRRDGRIVIVGGCRRNGWKWGVTDGS